LEEKLGELKAKDKQAGENERGLNFDEQVFFGSETMKKEEVKKETGPGIESQQWRERNENVEGDK